MYRFLLGTIALSAITIQPSFGQTQSLGTVYQQSYGLSDHSKDLKILEKQLSKESSQNKNKFDENLQQVKSRGYSFRIWAGISNSNLKTLLAIDDRLVSLQSVLDSKIRNLQNSNLIDSMRNPIKHASYYGSIQDQDYNFLDLYQELIDRSSKLRKQYSVSDRAGSTETNSWYLTQVLAFNQADDPEKLKRLEHSLADRKLLSEQSVIVIAKHQQELAENYKKESAERLAERERIRFENENQQKQQSKIETEIASLPSKAVIRTKFRTYKHKTGHVFEMFPANFTPKPNKSSYDKVRYFGKTYTAQYCEHNDYGINSLVIEYRYSGKISTVTVFNGSDPIYIANYSEGSDKPDQILTKSADGKFSLSIQRSYNFRTNKMEQTISYHYLPLDYYYDEE